MSNNIYVHKRIFFVLLISCILFSIFALVAYMLGNTKNASNYVDMAKDKQLDMVLQNIHSIENNINYSLEVKPLINQICKNHFWNNQQQYRDEILANIEDLNLKLANLNFVKYKYIFDAKQWLLDMQSKHKSCTQTKQAIASVNKIPLNKLFWSENSKSNNQNLYVAKGNINFNSANPWNSLYGCILLEKNGQYINAQKINNKVDKLCKKIGTQPTQELTDKEYTMPPNINFIVSKLQGWRNPDSEFFATAMQNKQNLIKQANGQEIQIGLHSVLTIDPDIQKIAGKITSCFSGNKDSCKEAKIDKNVGANMYDKARVRQIGIAVIDIPTGKIQALASSDSDCRRLDAMDSSLEHKPNKCPNIGKYMRQMIKQDTDALLNHAIFTAIPPASTIKPIIAAGLFMDKTFNEPNIASYIKKSDSIAFADMMFCRRGGGSIQNCNRPYNVVQAAKDLGWNQDCSESLNANDSGLVGICGKSDLLTGRRMGFTPNINNINFNPISQPYLKGKIFINSDSSNMKPHELYNNSPAFINQIKECAMKNYAGCTGDLNSQVLGQGNSRITAVGTASMMGNLVSIANTAKGMRYPYILQNLLNSDGTINKNGNPIENNWQGDIRQNVEKLTPQIAAKVLNIMKATASGGTANISCSKIFSNCDKIDFIASKTGTADNGINLNTLLIRKNNIYVQWRSYAGVFKSSNKVKDYDKAFDVIIERNWQANGVIDGQNPAVDAGLYMIRNIRNIGAKQ